jgi:hypothetical protein
VDGQSEESVVKHRIKVNSIGPGVFSNERSVAFEVGGQSYTLIVPAQYVGEDGTIEVEVVAVRGEDVLVDLPRETFTSGNRIRMPRAELLPA